MKISIVTICYNSEKTILDTINSVNEQLYKNIEHVFIDGLSKDSTLEIIKKKSSRLIKLISEKDMGIYDAMNKGIKYSTGEYILFLNSDDILFEKDTIIKIVNQIKSHSLDVLYGNIIFMNNNLSQVKRKWVSSNYTRRKCYFGWHPPHPGMTVSKKVIEDLKGFNIDYKIIGDYDFMLKLFLSNQYKIRHIDNYLVKMRLGGASTTFSGMLTTFVELQRLYKRNNFNFLLTYFNIFRRYTMKLLQILN